jgi:hypothetical protein
MEEGNFVSRSLEHPLSCLGLGGAIAILMVSPSSFNYGFTAAGCAIAVGLLRSKAFSNSRPVIRFLGNILIVACFGAIWFWLWKVVPKPTEPVTKQDVYDALSKSPVRVADGNKPITKAELQKLIQQYRSPQKISNNLGTPESVNQGDRRIGWQQISDLKHALAPFPKGTVGIATIRQKPERVEYATELAGAFTQAGWTAVPYCVEHFDEGRSGLLVLKHPGSTMPDVSSLNTGLQAMKVPHSEVYLETVYEYPTGNGVPCDSSKTQGAAKIGLDTPVIFVGSKN